MKYYIIAGEASGDLHGSNLMKALKEKDADADFRVWGGDLMEQAGGKLVKHYRDLAFMGFIEVISNLRTILNNLESCKRDVADYQPDVIILIDYPGFNLRIAKWAKSAGLRVFYYISPQLWAWHRGRIYQIRKNVEHMFVILPFEKSFYQQYHYTVDFVGHPLLDVVSEFRPDPTLRSAHQLDDRPIIALLPGSRRQEVCNMLPVMLEVAGRMPGYQFVIAGAPSQPQDRYEQIISRTSVKGKVKLVFNRTYDILANAEAAIVTSGTATLETALFDVPQVVCYKGNSLSFFIARRLVTVNFISLVNLIVNKPLIREILQDALTTNNLEEELRNLLTSAERNRIREGYRELRHMLGEKGASRRAAGLMFDYLKNQTPVIP